MIFFMKKEMFACGNEASTSLTGYLAFMSSAVLLISVLTIKAFKKYIIDKKAYTIYASVFIVLFVGPLILPPEWLAVLYSYSDKLTHLKYLFVHYIIVTVVYIVPVGIFTLGVSSVFKRYRQEYIYLTPIVVLVLYFILLLVLNMVPGVGSVELGIGKSYEPLP